MGKLAHRAGLALGAESAIPGDGRGDLGALEKHLPGIFVHYIEESGQSLVLSRVEFPQIEGPSLTWEDPTEERGLDYVDKFNLLVHQVLNAGLESGHLFRITPQQARLFLGCEPGGDARLEFGGRCPLRVTRLGDVEPPRLPPLDGFHEGALESCDVGHLAHHGASALRLPSAHDLRLDVEDLQP